MGEPATIVDHRVPLPRMPEMPKAKRLYLVGNAVMPEEIAADSIEGIVEDANPAFFERHFGGPIERVRVEGPDGEALPDMQGMLDRIADRHPGGVILPLLNAPSDDGMGLVFAAAWEAEHAAEVLARVRKANSPWSRLAAFFFGH